MPRYQPVQSFNVRTEEDVEQTFDKGTYSGHPVGNCLDSHSLGQMQGQIDGIKKSNRGACVVKPNSLISIPELNPINTTTI